MWRRSASFVAQSVSGACVASVWASSSALGSSASSDSTTSFRRPIARASEALKSLAVKIISFSLAMPMSAAKRE
jgi:hypothetical protein